ncbi:MAG: PRC-barrel domain-containing protein [Caldilineales bacterium]
MNIPLNVDVQCTDGEGGRAVAAVLDPVRLTMSHIVVDVKGHGSKEHLVPLEYLTASTPKSISLRCTREELSYFEPFLKMERVDDMGIGMANAQGLAYAEFQSGISTTDFEMAGGGPGYIETEAIPANEIATRHGIPVQATDHKVGQLDEFMVDTESGQITHIVLKEGHLFGRKEIPVAADQIDRIGEIEIFLKLSKDEVEALPSL